MSENLSADTPMEIPLIKIKEKLGFMSFSASINIVYIFRSLYWLFFMTEVLKLNMAIAGTIVAVGTVWDAINDPLIGYWSMNRKFKNNETLRPFALWHSFPWAITLILLFTNLRVSPTMTIALALLFYCSYEVFNTTTGLPYQAMAGLATNRESDRRSINVFRNLGATIGTAVGAVACLPLLKMFGALNADGNLNQETASRGFFLVACIMGIIMLAGSLIHYKTTKERVSQISDEDSQIPFKKVISMLFQCRSWCFNMLFFIGYNLSTALRMQTMAYYTTYVIGSTAAVTNFQITYLGATLLGSLFVSSADRKLGRKKTMIVSCVISLLGKIWFLINPFSMGAMYLNSVCGGIAIAFSFVLFNTNRNNIVDIIEAHDGRRIDSMLAVTEGLFSKMAVAGATMLAAFMLNSAGYDANLSVQPASVTTIINLILGWVSVVIGIGMAIAAFLLPIEKEYDEAKKILQEAKLKHQIT